VLINTAPDAPCSEDPVDNETTPLPEVAVEVDDATCTDDWPSISKEPPAADEMPWPAANEIDPPSLPSPAATDTEPPLLPTPSELAPTDTLMSPEVPPTAAPVDRSNDPEEPDNTDPDSIDTSPDMLGGALFALAAVDDRNETDPVKPTALGPLDKTNDPPTLSMDDPPNTENEPASKDEPPLISSCPETVEDETPPFKDNEPIFAFP